MFLIKKLWTDSMENHHSEAIGYRIIGYVTTREEAERIVTEGGEIAWPEWPFNGKSYSRFQFCQVMRIDGARVATL